MKLKICHYGFELKQISIDVCVLNLLSSTYLLSFGLILVWNDMLAVERMRLLKRNLCGSENLGEVLVKEGLELVKTWISTVRLSD